MNMTTYDTIWSWLWYDVRHVQLRQ